MWAPESRPFTGTLGLPSQCTAGRDDVMMHRSLGILMAMLNNDLARQSVLRRRAA
jgi:hypothetical protein